MSTTISSKTTVDDIIDQVLSRMSDVTPGSEEFTTLVEQLSKLSKVRTEVKPDQISKDQLLAVGGNILGILAVINYERIHVITTKALGFISKTR